MVLDERGADAFRASTKIDAVNKYKMAVTAGASLLPTNGIPKPRLLRKVFSVGIAIERHMVMIALAIDSQLPPTVYGRLRDSVGIASACDRRRVGSTPSTLPLP